MCSSISTIRFLCVSECATHQAVGRVGQPNHPRARLGHTLRRFLLITLVIGDGSVLCMMLVDELLEMVVDARRQVLLVQRGALPYGGFNRCTAKDVYQPAAMRLGAKYTDVLVSLIQTGSNQGSRARCQIDHKTCCDLFEESLVPLYRFFFVTCE